MPGQSNFWKPLILIDIREIFSYTNFNGAPQDTSSGKPQQQNSIHLLTFKGLPESKDMDGT